MIPTYIDHYCERTHPGMWNEPYNVLSNLGFFVAAYLLLKLYRNKIAITTTKNLDMLIMIGLVFSIGLGSTLWHLNASSLTLWADRIPILLLINLYILSSLFRVLGCKIQIGIALFLLYQLINLGVLSLLPLEALNRSVFYLPTWGYLATLTIVVWTQNIIHKNDYLLSLIAFSIALVFRSLDNTLCNFILIGTHFVWHILISYTLYLTMRALILSKL